jgi:hypothetical protein
VVNLPSGLPAPFLAQAGPASPPPNVLPMSRARDPRTLGPPTIEPPICVLGTAPAVLPALGYRALRNLVQGTSNGVLLAHRSQAGIVMSAEGCIKALLTGSVLSARQEAAH